MKSLHNRENPGGFRILKKDLSTNIHQSLKISSKVLRENKDSGK